MKYKLHKDKVMLASLPTPVEKLDLKINGYSLYVKRDDLTGAELTGNKVRKLEYLCKDAKDNGVSVLITCGGIQSNHARATAVAATKLGMKAHLFLATDDEVVDEGNVLIDKLFGAKITTVRSADFENINQIMEEAKEEYANRGIKAYPIPLGASNAIGNLGYLNAFNEILEYEEEAGVVFDTIVCPVGSGGTYSGLWIGNYLNKSGKKIVGVNVSQTADYFKNVISDISTQTLGDLGESYKVQPSDVSVIDGFVGKGYAISSKDEIDFIKDMVIKTGILFDPVYTGKAFKGLIDTLNTKPESVSDKPNSNVLFVHTGGLYSVFARAEDFFGNTL